MSPEQVDRVVKAAIPELKIALESVLENGAVHIFTLADATNSKTGIKTKLVCFIALDAPAAILEGTLKGIEEAQEINIRNFRQLKALEEAGKGEEIRP